MDSAARAVLARQRFSLAARAKHLENAVHYLPQVGSRGEERSEKCMRVRRPRRWVVERVASWLNRYRRILVRWEKKLQNYQALLHLVFAHFLWRNS